MFLKLNIAISSKIDFAGDKESLYIIIFIE